MDLLLLAAWKDHKGRGGKTIRRGEVHVSQMWLALRWGWNRRQVQRFLARLEKAKMCRTKAGTKGCTLTIENYELYQEMRAASAHQSGHIRRSKEVKNISPPDGGGDPSGLPVEVPVQTDQEVFAELEALGIDRATAAKAGFMLKGKGRPWTPHTLGALLYSRNLNDKDDPVAYARTAKLSDSVPDQYAEQASSILKRCRERAASKREGVACAS